MAELGVSCDVEEIDILKGDNRQDAYLAVNPGAGLPALALDDGRSSPKSQPFANTSPIRLAVHR